MEAVKKAALDRERTKKKTFEKVLLTCISEQNGSHEEAALDRGKRKNKVKNFLESPSHLHQ